VPAKISRTLFSGFVYDDVVVVVFSQCALHHHRIFSAKVSWMLIALFSAMAGYGVYLGRFLHWHSKDLLVSPSPVLYDVVTHLVNPTAQAMTGMFFLIILSAYLCLNCMIHLNRPAL
jgi:uncharacterized membrane protein